ncbi:hypothetical protein AB0D04_27650 [Streptomyces sp. NPDC048483]|uniref:hypothetical protein n=1 Tax=Streptomyces sp. NPDC048483 TaxID=3154927 RepID=UPI00343CE9B2
MRETCPVVVVSVEPSRFAAWFHRLLTTPVIEIDGRRHEAQWGTEAIAVGPGDHHISVYFHYRGRRTARLAEATRAFSVEDAAGCVEIAVTLGPRNGSTFRIADPVSRPVLR